MNANEELVAKLVREVGYCPTCNPGTEEHPEGPQAGPYCTHAARLFSEALAAGEPPAELETYVTEAACMEPPAYWHKHFATVAELRAELEVFRAAGGFGPNPPECWPY